MDVGTELARGQTCFCDEVDEIRWCADDHVMAATLEFQTERNPGLNVPATADQRYEDPHSWAPF